MSPGPGSGHPHGENLVFRAISQILLGAGLPLCAPQVSPTPPDIGHVCCSRLTSPAGERLWDTTATATPKAMSGWRISHAVSKLPEQPGSRQAGLNVNASTQSAKSRRPKGTEKGFIRQGSESTWRGRGQAKPGLIL